MASQWFRTRSSEISVVAGAVICVVFFTSSLVVADDGGSTIDLDVGSLRDEAKSMFYHAYNAYMEKAFPADELMPLSCKGRFRGVQPNRGDIDDALGNFSLTLIDSLDSLVVIGDIPEFERAVKLVIDTVTFDHDLAVSVFETNIRIVGGLVSAHILAELLATRGEMRWYKGELLNMALDVGYRLLPAFNSTTGLPYPRVNLRHGIKAGKVKKIGETCTACAGTMILEFAALSRLSGEPIFEEKASRAMDVLWINRHRVSNLVGNVLNIHTGDWVRRESGIGAGIDSYYEYVAKAYVLLGEEKYFKRWNAHYAAVMKYLGQGHVMQDVHMHRPHATSKNFVDALGAFWPGLQVLMGDIRPAIESHEVLFQVMKRHNFIPEAFTTDFQVHWGQHLLRPEFVESTYFLYKATGDPHYLRVGEKILRSLQKHARVDCGYATIKDVRTLQKEDRMDSFVLSETFKYLYLLFADDADLPIDINGFVFTTEGHLLPLSLARLSNRTVVPLKNQSKTEVIDEDVEFARSCPSSSYLFPDTDEAKNLRQSLANVVESKFARSTTKPSRLLASEFQAGNLFHLSLVREMGISLTNLDDGRMQLTLTPGNAVSTSAAEEGTQFMHEMMEMSKFPPTDPSQRVHLYVSFKTSLEEAVNVVAGPAQFGSTLGDGVIVRGLLARADPFTACEELSNGAALSGRIVLVKRGDCTFVEKARNIQRHGVKAGIVIDNNSGTSHEANPLFAMSGDGTDDVEIPLAFLFSKDALPLLDALQQDPDLEIAIKESSEPGSQKPKGPEEDSSSSFDLSAQFSELVEQSKKQVKKYLGGMLQQIGEAEDKDKDLEQVLEVEGDGVNFDKLETLLNPKSEKIRNKIETYVLKNPRLLSMMLGVKFGDLTVVFKHFIKDQSDDLVGAYVKVFELLEAKGEGGITELAENLRLENAHDSGGQDVLVQHVLTEYVDVEEGKEGRSKVSALLDLMSDGIAEAHASSKEEKDEL